VQIDVCGEIKLFFELELELSVAKLKLVVTELELGQKHQLVSLFFLFFFKAPIPIETKDPFSPGSFNQD
jgi:hypothetical protein